MKTFFRQAITAAAAILMAAGPSGAAARFDEKVRADFFAGFAGDSARLRQGMSSAEEAMAGDPHGAAEARSWHGSGLLFLSGQKFQAGDMAAGGQLWAQAAAEMDEAGRMEPDNPAVLIPRAATRFAASRFSPPEMGEPILKQALADYEHVYELQKPFFDKLGMHPRSELLFGLADGYARDQNPAKAREYFEKLAALGPASGHAEQARQYLDTGKYTVTGIGCAGCHTGK